MNYENFDVSDFVNDTFFMEWVKRPDETSQTYWQNWLDEHPEKKPVVQEARQVLLFLSFETLQPNHQEFMEVKRAIKAQMHQEPISISEPQQLGKPVHHFRPYYQAAAVLAGFILLSAIYMIKFRSGSQQQYHTAYGKTQTIELPDHSVVMLNANSTLRYNTPWESDKPREVWLSGEAFFEVSKKLDQSGTPSLPQSKFTVHTNALDVQVLGTEFNVQNRTGRVNVLLASGKVRLDVHAQNQPDILMNPGDLVEVAGKIKSSHLEASETQRYTAWRQQKLVFVETPMLEVARTIEEYYGVKVECRDPKLITKRFTGSIPNNNLKVLLTVLGESFGIQITYDKNKIIMESKR